MKAKVLGLLMGTFMCAGVQASLINKGNYTLDTTTSLDWYNPALTAGMSYQSVLMGLGSAAEPINLGFQYATLAQFEALMTTYVGPANLDRATSGFSIAAANGYYAGALNTILALGPVAAFSDPRAPYNITQPPTVQITTQGYIAGDGHVGSAALSAVIYGPNGYGQSLPWLSGAYGSWGGDNSPSWNVDPGPWIGSFLVRPDPSGVPEPSSVALLGLALAGLAVSRRERQ